MTSCTSTLLSGKTALVTGSSRGVGLSIARALHSHGAKIVINYAATSSASGAESLASQLDGIAIRADVASQDDVRTMFAKAENHFSKPVDIVVNNALGDFAFNGQARKKLSDISWTDFEAQLHTTLQGALNTTQAALPGFRKVGGGRIINIGTNLVQNPVVPYQDYTSAKGALLAFTHTTAAELGPENVTCNMVAGGLLKVTDASRHTPDEVFDQIKAITPLRRVTTPEDLADAVVFFASPLSRAVTGQQIIVDGGLVMT